MTTKQEMQKQLDEFKAEMISKLALALEAMHLKINAMPDEPEKEEGHLLFYPEADDAYYTIAPDIFGDYFVRDRYNGVHKSFKFPVFRTEKQAERVAWGRGQMDIWRAMGEMPREGAIEQYYINPFGLWSAANDDGVKGCVDALFPTRRSAWKALEEFGGIKHLQEARAAAGWGK